MPHARTARGANPKLASERDSAFGPLRRLYYRNEGRLIVAWLALLLGLNSLPVVWHLLNERMELESQIIRERDDRWSRPLREAAKLARQGKTEQAVARYESVLSMMPPLQIPDRGGRERLEAATQLARLQLQAGKAKRARRLAADVVESDPLDYRAHTAYADALAELGKTDRALPHYHRSLEMNPVQLDVVKTLMSLDAEKTRHESVIARVNEYLDATFVSKGAIYFAENHDDLDASKDVIRFPVILDGEPHTYKIFTNTNRNPGATRFSSLPRIEGLRFVPALVDHVVAKIESLTIHFDGGDLGPKPLVFLASDLDQWRTVGHLEVLGDGLTHSPQSLSSLASPVEIANPARVTHIEIRMALQRPVDSEFLDMMQLAYRNTMRGDRGEALASRLRPFDQIARVSRKEPTDELAAVKP